MSGEIESIILGVIALSAGIGTAVAIRKRTARIAVGCCIVGAVVMLLYAGRERAAVRQAQLRDEQNRMREIFTGEGSADRVQTMVVLPNGTVVRSNAVEFGQGGAVRRGAESRDHSGGAGMRGDIGTTVDDIKRGTARRRLPIASPPEDPPQQPLNDSSQPSKKSTEDH